MSQPNKKKRLELKPEDEAKLDQIRSKVSKPDLEPEWEFIAQFGKYFGWGGVQAILDNRISLSAANALMRGADVVEKRENYERARASFIGQASARRKRPLSTFKRLTKDYFNE